jgi:hypothetical protein
VETTRAEQRKIFTFYSTKPDQMFDLKKKKSKPIEAQLGLLFYLNVIKCYYIGSTCGHAILSFYSLLPDFASVKPA